MNKLKILFGLVGMFKIFSFVNASAMERGFDDRHKNNMNFYDKSGESKFTVGDLDGIYRLIREDDEFEKNFHNEMEYFFKEFGDDGSLVGSMSSKSKFCKDLYFNYAISMLPSCFSEDFTKELLRDPNKKEFDIEYIMEKMEDLDDSNFYEFKIENGKVVCVNPEGEDLAKLINYYMCLLRFKDFVSENPKIIDEYYNYRKNKV